MREPPTWTRRRVFVVGAVAVAILLVLIATGRISSDALIFLAVLFPSVILHEVSHGAVALAFGDDTAKRAGRLTLNPLPHVDPLGTVVVPALMSLAGGPVLGWAKPVPVNPGALRRPRDHALVVSLAGPAVNVAIALLAALAVHLYASAGGGFRRPDGPLVGLQVLYLLGVVNVFLAVFNLIPIPPLDGSAVVERFLPRRWWPGYLRFRQYSMLILLALFLLFYRQVGDFLFLPVVELWEQLL